MSETTKVTKTRKIMGEKKPPRSSKVKSVRKIMTLETRHDRKTPLNQGDYGVLLT